MALGAAADATKEAALQLSNLLSNSGPFHFFSSRETWSLTLKGVWDRREILARFTRKLWTPTQADTTFKDVVPYRFVTELEHPLSTGARFLVIRDFKPHMLADREVRIKGRISQREVTWRTLILRDVLRGIGELHSERLIHGDVRPENISIDKSAAELTDFGSPTPISFLSSDQRQFRPFAESKPSYATDLFAAGQLMEEMLLHQIRYDTQLPTFALQTREIAWVADFVRSHRVGGPESAKQLYAILFGSQDDVLSRAGQRVSDARKDLLRIANRSNRMIVPFPDIQVLSQRAAESALSLVKLAPYTALALERKKDARAVLALLPIDSNAMIPHTAIRKQDSQAEHIAPDSRGIDERWSRQLEAQTASFATAAEYDADLQDAIDFAARLREELLAETAYVDQQTLIGVLTHEELEVTDESMELLRQWGKLFAVPDHGDWLYPIFQFDEALGIQHPIVNEVNRRFDADESEWTVLSWWLTPHAFLKGQTPAVAISDPNLRSRIIEAIDFSLS